MEDHDKSVKCLAKLEGDSSIVATGGRDGKIFIYDLRIRQPGVAHFNLMAEHFFNQQLFSRKSGKYCPRKYEKPSIPSVTGLAFYGNQLVSIESHSDTISFFDLREVESYAGSPSALTTKQRKGIIKQPVVELDNSFYHINMNDTYNSTKGNISLVIQNHKMLINSMDNVVSLYDMLTLD